MRAFDNVTAAVCSRCLKLAWAGKIWPDMVMPLPEAPALSREDNQTVCCRDCQAADALAGFDLGMDFMMARVAIGNDRADHLRMPYGMSEHFGLVKAFPGLVLPCSIDDLEGHQKWLEANGFPVSREEATCKA